MEPQKRKVVRTVIVLALCCLLPLILIWANYAAIRNWNQVKALKDHGKTTRAAIISSTANSSGKRQSYYLTLEWTVPNSPKPTFSKRIQVEEFYYSMYESKDSVTILYLPEKPDVANLEGNEAYYEDLLIAGIIDLMVLISLLVVFRMWRKEKQKA